MDLTALNGAGSDDARNRFLECCCSTAWADAMVSLRPFANAEEVLAAASREWLRLTPADWLEAFASHPRIGESAGGNDRHARWSRAEQTTAATADPLVLDQLRECSIAYQAQFGHVFLVSATGKTAGEILAACRTRLANDPDTELGNAAAEQAKITDLRIRRLLGIG